MKTILFSKACACLFLFYIISIPSIFAQTANSGPKSGSVFAADGLGALHFTNCGNVQASDNNRSTAVALLTLLDGATDAINVTGFSLGIPSGTFIEGILVEIEKSASNISLFATVTDNSVRLLKAGNQTGSNYAKSDNWTTSDTYDSYGGPNDLWGTSWTPTEINSSLFGVSFSSYINGLITLLPSARVDHIRITVYYEHVVLPAYNTSLTASWTGLNQALVSWQLPGEKQFSNVELQRSDNAREWITICKNIPSKIYNYVDKDNSLSRSYYRLRFISETGQSFYSGIAFLGKQQQDLTVYPNPAIHSITITGIKDVRQLRCISMQGKIFPVSFITTAESTWSANISSLPSGIYLICGEGQKVILEKK